MIVIILILRYFGVRSSFPVDNQVRAITNISCKSKTMSELVIN